MTIKCINPSKLLIRAQVNLPGSKSLTNRALIIAAMAEGKTTLNNVLFSDDIEACLVALRELGIKLEIDRNQNVVIVSGSSGIIKSDVTLNARDAGTVSRFLLPACAALGGNFRFIASTRMCERPMGTLLENLSKQGVSIDYEGEVGYLPLSINSSRLSGGKYIVPGNKSSQFLSGLLIASPYAQSDTLLVSDSAHQQPYVKMTTDIMKSFGVKVECDDHKYYIRNKQKYLSTSYNIEPDISTATYFWAVAALSGGEVTIANTSFDSLQGDIKFLNLMTKMNCDVRKTENGICVKGPDILNGVTADLRTYSDTFMTVAVLACFANSKTHLTGLAHTRLQESDRVDCMAKGLRALGAKVDTTEDTITIFPSTMHAGVVDGCNDHRIAMSLALVGIRVDGVQVRGADCVKKTCPDYFERMQLIVQ
jgi:3-phosphoshikimate 1-carboxyvinyltransferase